MYFNAFIFIMIDYFGFRVLYSICNYYDKHKGCNLKDNFVLRDNPFLFYIF